MGRTSKCRRYVIDLTGLDPLSLGELGAGVQCFGEFGASVHARTTSIGMPVRACTNLLDKVSFPDSTIWGAEGRGKIRKNEAFLTYEWVIGS